MHTAPCTRAAHFSLPSGTAICCTTPHTFRAAPSTTCPRCTTRTTCTLRRAPGSWPSQISTRWAGWVCLCLCWGGVRWRDCVRTRARVCVCVCVGWLLVGLAEAEWRCWRCLEAGHHSSDRSDPGGTGCVMAAGRGCWLPSATVRRQPSPLYPRKPAWALLCATVAPPPGLPASRAGRGVRGAHRGDNGGQGADQPIRLRWYLWHGWVCGAQCQAGGYAGLRAGGLACWMVGGPACWRASRACSCSCAALSSPGHNPGVPAPRPAPPCLPPGLTLAPRRSSDPTPTPTPTPPLQPSTGLWCRRRWATRSPCTARAGRRAASWTSATPCAASRWGGVMCVVGVCAPGRCMRVGCMCGGREGLGLCCAIGASCTWVQAMRPHCATHPGPASRHAAPSPPLPPPPPPPPPRLRSTADCCGQPGQQGRDASVQPVHRAVQVRHALPWRHSACSHVHARLCACARVRMCVCVCACACACVCACVGLCLYSRLAAPLPAPPRCQYPCLLCAWPRSRPHRHLSSCRSPAFFPAPQRQ